jgi:hypothetical protein
VERAEADVVETLRYAHGRLAARLVGLSDDEWAWRPVPADDRVTIRWRLDHIASLLAEPRCRTWLGLPADDAIALAPATGAADAVARVQRSFDDLDGVLGRAGVDLTREVGAVGGPYASSTRRAFVLHLVDELIHHGAEAALLRDLYAAR